MERRVYQSFFSWKKVPAAGNEIDESGDSEAEQ